MQHHTDSYGIQLSPVPKPVVCGWTLDQCQLFVLMPAYLQITSTCSQSTQCVLRFNQTKQTWMRSRLNSVLKAGFFVSLFLLLLIFENPREHRPLCVFLSPLVILEFIMITWNSDAEAVGFLWCTVTPQPGVSSGEVCFVLTGETHFFLLSSNPGSCWLIPFDHIIPFDVHAGQ